MDSIAVSRPSMAVLDKKKLTMSPFGALSHALAEEILARTGQAEGVYPYLPLDLLTEPEEQPERAPARQADPTVNVEVKLVLERPEAKNESVGRTETVERIVERIVRLREKTEARASAAPRPGTETDAPGGLNQSFFQNITQHISFPMTIRSTERAAAAGMDQSPAARTAGGAGDVRPGTPERESVITPSVGGSAGTAPRRRETSLARAVAELTASALRKPGNLSAPEITDASRLVTGVSLFPGDAAKRTEQFTRRLKTVREEGLPQIGRAEGAPGSAEAARAAGNLPSESLAFAENGPDADERGHKSDAAFVERAARRAADAAAERLAGELRAEAGRGTPERPERAANRAPEPTRHGEASKNTRNISTHSAAESASRSGKPAASAAESDRTAESASRSAKPAETAAENGTITERASRSAKIAENAARDAKTAEEAIESGKPAASAAESGEAAPRTQAGRAHAQPTGSAERAERPSVTDETESVRDAASRHARGEAEGQPNAGETEIPQRSTEIGKTATKAERTEQADWANEAERAEKTNWVKNAEWAEKVENADWTEEPDTGRAEAIPLREELRYSAPESLEYDTSGDTGGRESNAAFVERAARRAAERLAGELRAEAGRGTSERPGRAANRAPEPTRHGEASKNTRNVSTHSAAETATKSGQTGASAAEGGEAAPRTQAGRAHGQSTGSTERAERPSVTDETESAQGAASRHGRSGAEGRPKAGGTEIPQRSTEIGKTPAEAERTEQADWANEAERAKKTDWVKNAERAEKVKNADWTEEPDAGRAEAIPLREELRYSAPENLEYDTSGDTGGRESNAAFVERAARRAANAAAERLVGELRAEAGRGTPERPGRAENRAPEPTRHGEASKNTRNVNTHSAAETATKSGQTGENAAKSERTAESASRSAKPAETAAKNGTITERASRSAKITEKAFENTKIAEKAIESENFAASAAESGEAAPRTQAGRAHGQSSGSAERAERPSVTDEEESVRDAASWHDRSGAEETQETAGRNPEAIPLKEEIYLTPPEELSFDLRGADGQEHRPAAVQGGGNGEAAPQTEPGRAGTARDEKTGAQPVLPAIAGTVERTERLTRSLRARAKGGVLQTPGSGEAASAPAIVEAVAREAMPGAELTYREDGADTGARAAAADTTPGGDIVRRAGGAGRGAESSADARAVRAQARVSPLAPPMSAEDVLRRGVRTLTPVSGSAARTGLAATGEIAGSGKGPAFDVSARPVELTLNQPPLQATVPPQDTASYGVPDFLTDAAQNAAQSGFKSIGVTRTIAETARNISTQSALEIPGVTQPMVEWTSPSYRQQPLPAETQFKVREVQQPQTAQSSQNQSVHISEAEIRRTADKVYKIIEDRIRRERRRLGL